MRAGVYKQYLLVVLLVIMAFNYVDRIALGLLLQYIKIDLRLSDTQLGVLTGIAFAAFYSVMGIPLARWADRGNRVTLITLTTAIWSAAVAMCGLAGNFVQLLLIRMGVSVGEAGCMPPAHSLIAETFPRAERPRAMARYMLGWPLSTVIGNVLAGWLNEIYGWRMTFVLLALPGLGLAALAWFTIHDPRRSQPGHAATSGAADSAPKSLKAVAATLWNTPTFRHLLLGFSVLYFFGYGTAQWQPSYFIRSHKVGTGALGTWLAAIWGVGGFLGTYWGGELASRRAAHNERLQLQVIAVGYVIFGALESCVYLSTTRYVALALLTVAAVGYSMAQGPLFATIQTLVPERMRAMAIATIYLFANLVGMGLGPVAVGAVSDALRPMVGEESLRYALLATCPGYVWGAWHLWRSSRTVTQDLENNLVSPSVAAESRYEASWL